MKIFSAKLYACQKISFLNVINSRNFYFEKQMFSREHRTHDHQRRAKKSVVQGLVDCASEAAQEIASFILSLIIT